MMYVPPFDLDIAPLPDFAHTRTLDQALQVAIATISQLCSYDILQVTWAGAQPRMLFSTDATLARYQPDHAALAELANNHLLWLGTTANTLVVPLHARGELCGWMYLQAAEPLPELAPTLLALAGRLGPTLALHMATILHDERVGHLQILTDAGRMLSETLDIDRLFDAIYAAASRVLNITDFYVALFDQPADLFDLVYARLDGERVEGHTGWKASEGLAGVVLRSRRPLHTNDYLAQCAHQGVTPRVLRDMPPGSSWLGIPLVANESPVGVMNISSTNPDSAYSTEQVDLLCAIGAQAAVALSNARLYRQSERQAQQLAALNHIGRTITSSLDPERVPSLIMEQVCTLLDVAEGSLLLADAASGELEFAYTNGPVGTQLLGTRIPGDHGIAGYVMRSGQSLISNDVQGDQRFSNATDKSTGFTTKSLLAVPLRGVAGVQGVIEVLNRRDDQPFTAEDRHLLEAIADQAVIALENAHKFAQVDQALARRAQELSVTNALLQHNLQSLTALNALSMAITTSLRNPRDIFTMTARGMSEASNARGALVFVAEGEQLRQVVEVGVCDRRLALEAVCQRVLQAGRPELLHLEQPARAVFAVPLRAPHRLIGAICVFYAGNVPDPSEQETMVLFATQAAAAVESLDLFATIRNARDEMASILASTQEGMLLIAPDTSIIHANSALDHLTRSAANDDVGRALDHWLGSWEQRVPYPAEEWAALRHGITTVLAGSERYRSGQLQAAAAPSLEWAVLPVAAARGAGGALLVLRDISEAREAARLRQDLTNMIVHDLRSPLSSVMAAIDMLIKGVSGEMSNGQHNILGIAYASSLQMLDMINTLLDISRLEAGGMPLNIRACAMHELVARASERLTTLAQDRAIVMLNDVPVSLPAVAADSDLVMRVVQNLLANAVKFSGRGSTVLVQANLIALDARPMLQIVVIDRGIGIAPNDQAHVFAKFGQVGESRGGSGLGLTFCKLAVEAHAGQIWLESEPGIGSSFFFTLPLAD